MTIISDLTTNPEALFHVRIQGGGGGGGGRVSGPHPLKNHKNIGSLSNSGLDPLKNHKSM